MAVTRLGPGGYPIAAFPTVFVPPPPPGNKGNGGSGNGKGQGGDKGNKPPQGGGIKFDPYGRYAAYYEYQETQANRRRRRTTAAAFSTSLKQSAMQGLDEGSVDTTAGLHLIEQGIAA